jgi:hypothetical protein
MAARPNRPAATKERRAARSAVKNLIGALLLDVEVAF